MKLRRAVLGRRSSWGSLCAVYNCGIILGIGPLLEAEGCEEVEELLRQFFPGPERTPAIIFYDKARSLGSSTALDHY